MEVTIPSELDPPIGYRLDHGLQGSPAKVRPSYIFAGNIILVTFECIGKMQWFLANVITV